MFTLAGASLWLNLKLRKENKRLIELENIRREPKLMLRCYRTLNIANDTELSHVRNAISPVHLSLVNISETPAVSITCTKLTTFFCNASNVRFLEFQHEAKPIPLLLPNSNKIESKIEFIDNRRHNPAPFDLDVKISDLYAAVECTFEYSDVIGIRRRICFECKQLSNSPEILWCEIKEVKKLSKNE